MSIEHYELDAKDGTPLAASDVDGLIVAFVPVAGADTDVSGSLLDPFGTGTGELDWGRTITLTLTDADASITQVKVYLTGTNMDQEVIQETLTLLAAGTTESNYAFDTVTEVIYHVDGVVTAILDTLELGWAYKLQLPRPCTDLTKIRAQRADNTIDAGTVSTLYQTWEPTAGNQPNGALRFYMEFVV